MFTLLLFHRCFCHTRHIQYVMACALLLGAFLIQLPAASAATRDPIDLEKNPAFQGYRLIEKNRQQRAESQEAPAQNPSSPETTKQTAATQTSSPQSKTAPAEKSALPKPSASHFLADAEKAPVFAMIDLYSNTLSDKELDALSQTIWDQILNTGRYDLITRKNVIKILSMNDMLPADPYAPPMRPGQLGKVLDSDYLVFGNIDKISNTYTLALYIYYRPINKVVAKKSLIENDLDRMTRLLLPTVRQMLVYADVHRRRLINKAREAQSASSSATAAGRTGTIARGMTNEKLKERLSELEWKSTEMSNTLMAIRDELQNLDASAEARMEQLVDQIVDLKTEIRTLKQQTAAAPQQVTTSREPAARPEATAPEKKPAPVEKARSATNTQKSPTPERNIENFEDPAPIKKVEEKEPSADKGEKRLIVVDAGASQPADPQQARKLVEQARDLDYQDPKRLKHLKEAVQFAPDNQEYFRYYLHALACQQHYESLIEEGAAALKKFKGDAYIQQMIGYAHYMQQNFRQARQHLEQAVQDDPQSLDARRYLGMVLLNIDSGEARSQLQKYLELASSQPSQAEYVTEVQRELEQLGRH